MAVPRNEAVGLADDGGAGLLRRDGPRRPQEGRGSALPLILFLGCSALTAMWLMLAKLVDASSRGSRCCRRIVSVLLSRRAPGASRMPSFALREGA